MSIPKIITWLTWSCWKRKEPNQRITISSFNIWGFWTVSGCFTLGKMVIVHRCQVKPIFSVVGLVKTRYFDFIKNNTLRGPSPEGIIFEKIQGRVCYRSQRSCGKVMFSKASVILFTGGGMYPSMHWADTPLGRHLPLTTAAYWNAFLF